MNEVSHLKKDHPKGPAPIKLTVVIPVFNESENIEGCYSEMTTALSGCGYSYELLFVEDGSSDASFEKLSEMACRDEQVSIIKLHRNLGQQKALLFGLAHCDSEAIVTFDADLQIPAACIPSLAEKIFMGYDIVSGIRVGRKDSFIGNKVPSFIGRLLINRSLGIQIRDFGSPKAYSRGIVKDILLESSPHLIIPAAAFNLSNHYCEIPVQHRPRSAGKSKWSLFKRIETYFDIYVMYAARPFNWMMMSGAISFILSVLLGAGILFYRLLWGRKFAGTIIFFDFFLFFTGIHFISLALIGEFVLRIYRSRHFPAERMADGASIIGRSRNEKKTGRTSGA